MALGGAPHRAPRCRRAASTPSSSAPARPARRCRPVDCRRLVGRDDRAQAVRRDLCEYRMHADQDAWPAPTPRNLAAARGGLWSHGRRGARVDMGPSPKARADTVSANSRASIEQWLRSWPGRTVLAGRPASRRPTPSVSGDERLTARRAPSSTWWMRGACPTCRASPTSRTSRTGTILPLDHIPRTSGRHRGQLCRPRIRAHVSALWRRRDRSRERAAPGCARG